MELEQRITMNTQKLTKFERKEVPDVMGSDYEFNRFDKSGLGSNVSALMLSVNTDSYSNWRNATNVIMEAVLDKYPPEYFDFFCFIVSPCWKKKNKIVKYYGLAKSLAKEFGVGLLDFQFEKEIENENDIIFYGVVGLTSTNAREIFDLVSSNENGVLFACKKLEDSCFYDVVRDLASLIGEKNKSLTYILDIVKAVQSIVDKGAIAIFPYAWEETGEYHLDIFELRARSSNLAM